MPSEFFTTTIVAVLNLLTTYLLHSTLLLAIAALAAWRRRPQSHALAERLWKSAAVIPLLTAPLQILCGSGNPVFSPRWSEPTTQEIVETRVTRAVEETIGVHNGQPTTDSLDTASEPLAANTADVDFPANDPPLWWRSAAEPYDLLPIEDPAAAQIVSMRPPADAATDVAMTAPTAAASATNPASIVPPLSITATPPSPVGLATWLAGLAVTIVTVGLLRFIAAGQRFRRRMREFREVEAGPVRDALTRVVRRTSLRRRVRLLEAGDVSEPIAFGAWRWTIAVPRGIETRLDRRELEALLAHELAHLVRGDAWWLLIGRLLCNGLPFQPLNFLARVRWRQAAEFQCDDWAAECTHNSMTLAHCLTRMAEWRLDAADCGHALPAGGPQSTLSRRVERLLTDRPAADPWSRSRRRRLMTAITLIVVAVLCWHGPRTTLLAQFDDQRDALTPDGAARFDTDALADEIHSLNAELRQLERDLRQVELLLRNSNSPSQVRTIAARLSSRLADLRRHRHKLLARADSRTSDQNPNQRHAAIPKHQSGVNQ